jgi:protocatechuate 3,4-dioxygenase beta subunit
MTSTTLLRRAGWRRWLLACMLLAAMMSMGLWRWVAHRSARTEGTETDDARARAVARTGQSSSAQNPVTAGALPASQPSTAAPPRDLGGEFELSGQVTDEQGQPIEEARVLLRPQALTSLEHPVRTTTDAEGRYRLATLPPGLYEVSFSARRFLEHRVDRHTLSASGTLDAVLRPALRVEGRVVDEQGQPISGAEVRLAVPPDAGDWDDSDEYEQFGTLSLEQSGEDGRFVLDAPKRGPWRVSAYQKGYLAAAQEAVEAPTSTLELVLARGATLEVVVVDEQGQPMAGAECQLATDSKWIGEGRQQWTDERGRTVYEAVWEGNYVLSATTPYRELLRVTTQKLELRGRERRQVVLRMPAGWELQGVVVDTQGKPVPGATVRAVPDIVLRPSRTWTPEEWPVVNHSRRLREEWNGETGGVVITGPDGRFVLKHLLPRAYRIKALMPGYKFDAETTGSAVEGDGFYAGLRVPAGGGPVRLVLEWRGLVRGRVVGQGSGPLKSFTVNSREWQTEDGRFEVAVENEGSQVLLTFEAPGLAPTWRQVKLTPGKDVDLGDVVLAEGKPVRVQVVDAEAGGPVERASVLLVDERDSGSSSAGMWSRTGKQGEALLEAVERRPLTVVVRSDEHLEARVPLAAEQQEVTVTLQAGATVQGWIRGSRELVSFGKVLLYDETGVMRYWLDVRDGWYSRRGIAEGHYVARVERFVDEATVFSWQEVRVPGRGTVQLDFMAEKPGSLLVVQLLSEVDQVRLVPGRHPPLSTLAELRKRALRSRPFHKEYGQPLSFHFPALPAGPHTLVAWRVHRDRLEVYQREVEVPVGGSQVVELQPRWQPLPGTVTHSDAVWAVP